MITILFQIMFVKIKNWEEMFLGNRLIFYEVKIQSRCSLGNAVAIVKITAIISKINSLIIFINESN